MIGNRIKRKTGSIQDRLHARTGKSVPPKALAASADKPPKHANGFELVHRVKNKAGDRYDKLGDVRLHEGDKIKLVFPDGTKMVKTILIKVLGYGPINKEVTRAETKTCATVKSKCHGMPIQLAITGLKAVLVKQQAEVVKHA